MPGTLIAVRLRLPPGASRGPLTEEPAVRPALLTRSLLIAGLAGDPTDTPVAQTDCVTVAVD